jgi:hypothetical protein
MSRLFVSRTTARRPRNATPQLEALEQVLSLSMISADPNPGKTGVSSFFQGKSELRPILPQFNPQPDPPGRLAHNPLGSINILSNPQKP